MNVGTKKFKPLYSSGLKVGGHSSWSPDGAFIAFYAGGRGNHEIYLTEVGGKRIVQLTEGGDNLGPSFSTDGRWIAFTTYRDGNNEIYIKQVSGSNVVRLTTGAKSDWQPRWGP